MNKKIFIATVALGLLFTGAGCKKQLDINQNPNVPTLSQGTPAEVFPAAVVGTAAKTGSDLAIIGGMWAEYYTQSSLANQYTAIDSYNLPPSSTYINPIYDVIYANGIKNFQYVIDNSKAASDWNFYLMGTVMKAYTTALLVDMFDKIPYSQALQGKGNLNPAFDDGYSIYTNLISTIDTALSKDFTANTNTVPGGQDLVFGGDMAKWMAFAQTLKLKFYLRMVNAHNDVATAGINALYSSGATFLTSDAAITNYTDIPNQDNPLYEENIRSLNTNSNIKGSTTFISWLHANGDPRIKDFFNASNPTSINQGDYTNSIASYQAAPVFVESPNDPVEFLSGPESYFLQAEARLRYFGGAGAQALYESGVKAAFAAVGEDATTFLTPVTGAYSWGIEMEGGAPLSKLAQVMRQKWASDIYGCHGIEAFFDKNRTGFPATSAVYSDNGSYIPGQLVVAKNSVLPPGALPKRFVFPYDETSRNTNAPQTIVPSTTAVWWAL